MRQSSQELRGSQAEAAESGGCRSSLSRLLRVFLNACGSTGSRDSCCWSSVRRRLRGMKEGGCRFSLVRKLLEQLESLAVGVACSSTGRSGQSLPEQRETEAAGAARVAGGGCVASYRPGLQEQLESGACFGHCMPGKLDPAMQGKNHRFCPLCWRGDILPLPSRGKS